MNNDLIFLPILAHVVLVFILYIYLGIVKTRAVKAGSVDRAKAALNSQAWPEYVVKVSNNLANQFESPVIFYILGIVFHISGHVNSILVSIMCLYVLSRYLHTYIHVTSNYVPHRLKLFLIGVLILLGLTIWLVLKLISF